MFRGYVQRVQNTMQQQYLQFLKRPSYREGRVSGIDYCALSTDSSTGQYGNKYLIQIIANHEVDFGIQIDGTILKRFIERAFVMASEPA